MNPFFKKWKKHLNRVNKRKQMRVKPARFAKEEVDELALGPGVSICKSCLEFGVEVLNAPSPNS